LRCTVAVADVVGIALCFGGVNSIELPHVVKREGLMPNGLEGFFEPSLRVECTRLYACICSLIDLVSRMLWGWRK